MLLEFFRCYVCKRLNEKRAMLWAVETLGKGCICGSRKFTPCNATKFEIFVFILFNPTYLVAALKGREPKWVKTQ